MSVAGEQQPLLGATVNDPELGGPKHKEVLLDFQPNDPDNPRNWTPGFKWGIVLLLASMAFTVTFTCVGVVPVASRIVVDLDPNTKSTTTTSALLVTIWELGEAAGPLLIAPLSEVYGRYPVMNVCNLLFITATILAAISQSTHLFIAARMLTGLAVAGNVLNPSIIGDLFDGEERGSPMSLVMLAPLIGGAIGPAISGAVAQTWGWRWVLLIATILAIACEVLYLMCSRETYKMSILRQRVRRLQRESGEFGEQETTTRTHEDATKLRNSITRPFAVLFGSAVLMLLALFGGVAFSFFYVISTSLPDILEKVYGFNPAQTGSAFIAFSVGSFGSVFLCNFSLDRIYVRLRGPGGREKPEYRLPLAMIGGFILPFAITAYGWIPQLRLPVPLLFLSVASLGFTLLMTTIPLSAYVIDACGNYSASAMTGIIVSRCLMGTFLPLSLGPLAERFGYGWGCTFLGGLSLTVAVIPVLIFRYGEKWRQRSDCTKDE